MRYFKWVILSFLTFLIQTQASSFLNLSLNLTVILVYFFALKNLPRHSMKGYYSNSAEIKGTVFGVTVGLLEDILSGSILGVSFFSKGLIGFLSIMAFTGVFFNWTPLLGFIAIGFFTFLDGIISTSFRIFFTNIELNIIDTLKNTFIQTLINIPFGIILKPQK